MCGTIFLLQSKTAFLPGKHFKKKKRRASFLTGTGRTKTFSWNMRGHPVYVSECLLTNNA
uniref:Uncharacterized protein n=1 Tax=Daphnia galeata TaxID=27404 RepID=A0A8J2S5H4_9CRUS|nr:unnamed protein product [Daphnia galeata]